MARTRHQKGLTLIAADTEVVGDLRFQDQLYVNGHIEGNVLAGSGDGPEGTVIISEEGSVKGEIRAPHVVINGEVEGDVYASSRVELAARARVKGNVYYQLIEMQLGATVDGQLLHEPMLDAASVHPFPMDATDGDYGSRGAERH